MRHLLTKWNSAAWEASLSPMSVFLLEAHLVGEKQQQCSSNKKPWGVLIKKQTKDQEVQTRSLDASLFAHICLLNTFQFNYIAKLPSPHRTIVMVFRFFQVSISL